MLLTQQLHGVGAVITLSSPRSSRRRHGLPQTMATRSPSPCAGALPAAYPHRSRLAGWHAARSQASCQHPPAPAASPLAGGLQQGSPHPGTSPSRGSAFPCETYAGGQERLSEVSPCLSAPLSARGMLARRRKHMCGFAREAARRVAPLLDISLAGDLSHPFIPAHGGELNRSASMGYF